eukprot:scaffold1307_cov166-Ochromonas_danica.AAC.11
MEKNPELSKGPQSAHSNKDDDSRNDDGGEGTTRRYDNLEIGLLIDRFKKSDPEEMKKHVAHPNAFSLKELKAIAGYLKLTRNLNKDKLVENILKKLTTEEKVMEPPVNKTTGPPPSKATGPPANAGWNKFRKEQTTVQRVLNHGREEVALEGVESTTAGIESSASAALLSVSAALLSASNSSSSSAVVLEGSTRLGTKRKNNEAQEEVRKISQEIPQPVPRPPAAVDTSKSEQVDNKLQQESLQTRYATIAQLNRDMLTYEEQLKKMVREGKTEGDRSFALTKRLFDMVCADLEALIHA